MTAALLCGIGMFGLLGLVQPETNPWLIRLLLLGAGFSLGHAVGVVQAAAFTRIAPSAMGQATTLFHVQNRMGAALGIAVLGSLLVSFSAEQGEDAVFGYKLALFSSIGFLLAALLLARRIQDADAAASMSSKRPPASQPAGAATKPAP